MTNPKEPLHIPLKKIKLNTKKAPDPLQCQMLFIISAEALFFIPYFLKTKLPLSYAARDFCLLIFIFILYYIHFKYILLYTFIYSFRFLHIFFLKFHRLCSMPGSLP